MPRNRLLRVMKHYSPTGRRNHGRTLKRLLDTWDRNGATSGSTAWQIDDDNHWMYRPFDIYVLYSHMHINVTQQDTQQKAPWWWRTHVETCRSCRILIHYPEQCICWRIVCVCVCGYITKNARYKFWSVCAAFTWGMSVLTHGLTPDAMNWLACVQLLQITVRLSYKFDHINTVKPTRCTFYSVY
jgi:hypothetical protein